MPLRMEEAPEAQGKAEHPWSGCSLARSNRPDGRAKEGRRKLWLAALAGVHEQSRFASIMPRRPRVNGFALRLGALCCLSLPCLWAKEGPHGRLVYPDGNCVTGVLEAPGQLSSDRFGPVSFAAGEARFEADAPTTTGRQPKPEAVTPLAKAPAPAPKLWTAAMELSLERLIEDRDHKLNLYTSAHLDRAHANGEQVSLFSEYEYIRKPENIDTRRALARGDWRHDLTGPVFSLFRPYVEYNGQNWDLPQPYGRYRLNYLLVRPQGGLGVRLLETDRLKISLSATWNYFYLHAFHQGTAHLNFPSTLLDTNLALPWSMKLTLQGEAIYYTNDSTFGWELRGDLSKQLSDHFRVVLREEYRSNLPISGANYQNRLKLLLGYVY